MPHKIINFINCYLKKIVVIIVGIFCFANLQSSAQALSSQDSITLKAKLKQTADSTRMALQKIALKKRADSIAAVIKQRQIDRKRKADSIRIAKKKQRAQTKKQHQEFVFRKKERERIRDSVAKESKRAAAARKAYLKSQKGKKKKSAVAKKVKDSDNKSEENKKKADRLTREKKQQEKILKEQEKERRRKLEYANAKRKKAIKDSIKNQKKKAAALKKANSKLEKEKQTVKKKTDRNKQDTDNKVSEKEKKKLAKQKEDREKEEKRKRAYAISKRKKAVKDSLRRAKKALVKQKKNGKTSDSTKLSNDNNEKKEQALAKQKKVHQDSIRQSIKQEKRARDTSRIASIYKDDYVRSNYSVRKLSREPPDKKKTYLAFQFGSSNYLGDLGGNSALENNPFGNINFKENTYFYGFSLSHIRREAVGLRFSYVFGKIAGSDKNTYFKDLSDPSYSRYVRNLDFQTSINEGSLMLELYPFKFLSYKTRLHNSYFQPYGLIGIGNYSFNPQGSYFDPILEENVWIDLQPLMLEGQGMTEHPDRETYKLSQWNIPFGFGFTYEISPTISLGLESVGRVLFTDYLDDVSTNFINPTLFDTYLSEENAELAKILNNKSKLINADRAYTPGQQRGNSNSNDFYFSVSGRLIIKLNRNKKAKAIKPFFKYDDNEICD